MSEDFVDSDDQKRLYHKDKRHAAFNAIFSVW